MQSLEELVTRAEQQALSASHEAARTTCRQALAAARLEGATPDWLGQCQDALSRLGFAAYRVGDLEVTDTAWTALLRHRETTLADDHPELQQARLNLANVRKDRGDLRTAHALEVKVVAIFTSTLPEDHPHLLLARENLGRTSHALGELGQAREHQEAVRAIRSRSLPEDHPLLLRISESLANTRFGLGDFRGALDLFERLLELRSQQVPRTHPDITRIRERVGTTKSRLHDSVGALPIQKEVLEILTRDLPEDHVGLQDVRLELALTMEALGDLRGAHELQERAVAVLARQLPDDHPKLLRARGNLANTKFAMGDVAGARQLQESVLEVCSRTLPDDHEMLQLARENLANTMSLLGDLRGALALQEKVMSVRSQAKPVDQPALQRTALNIGAIKRMLGDLQGARKLEEHALRVLSRALPEHHPDVLTAHQNLALTLKELGDLRGALELETKLVAISSRVLPPDHPELQAALGNLAATKGELGDVRGAHDILESVVSIAARTLPEDHPNLLDLRGNLAVFKKNLGDLRGAHDLQVAALAIRERSLPDDHPILQAARSTLASTRKGMGDLRGAIALQEKVLAVLQATLPDDHLSLQMARGNLGGSKRAIGDLYGAAALQEKALAVCASTLPEDHPYLQLIRIGLAGTREAQGDLAGASSLMEAAMAAMSKSLPDDHPDLLQAKQNLSVIRAELGDLSGALQLFESVAAAMAASHADDHPTLLTVRLSIAITKKALGDRQAALALEERILATLSGYLPPDHPDLARVRWNLTDTQLSLGDVLGAARTALEQLRCDLARLWTNSASTREFGQLAIAASRTLFYACSTLDAHPIGAEPSPAVREAKDRLSELSLELLDAVRSGQGDGVARLRGLAAAGGSSRELGLAIDRASRDLEAAIALPAAGGTSPDGRQIRRDDAIREAVLAKDAAERAMFEMLPANLRSAPTCRRIAACLAADEAAVTFLKYTRWTDDPEHPGRNEREDRIGAFVLAPSGQVTWHSLASAETVEEHIAAIRREAGRGAKLAPRSAVQSAEAPPGADPEPAGEPDALATNLKALHDQLLAPLLAALPKGTRRLVVSPADELLLVPLEDLQLTDGRAFGEAFDVRTVLSLRALTRPATPRPAEPRALVLGGIDYDGKPATTAPVVPDTATPIVEGLQSTSDPASSNRSSDGTARHFQPLAGSATETRRIDELFRATFASTTPTVLVGSSASEAAFTEQAPGKAFLHLATHGYFAPESAWRATDQPQSGPLARFDIGQRDRTAQLSPFSLTGLTFAGANLPPDALGRREGILTAQELVGIDLTACHLATLSACNTSLGVRRAGTGLASLRQAFHAAGARFVVATLWEVDDAEAQKLMADFYARMWKDGAEPRTALRTAKQAAQARGAAFRDWAGWTITGW